MMQVLSDDEKRSLYDRFGEAGLKGAGQGGPGVRSQSWLYGFNVGLYC